MGLFDRFKKDKAVDFSVVDSQEKVEELAKQGVLVPLYLMPLRFNGEESAANRLFVPPAAVAIKDRYDDMVEKLLTEGKVNGYACTPPVQGEQLRAIQNRGDGEKGRAACFLRDHPNLVNRRGSGIVIPEPAGYNR